MQHPEVFHPFFEICFFEVQHGVNLNSYSIDNIYTYIGNGISVWLFLCETPGRKKLDRCKIYWYISTI